MSTSATGWHGWAAFPALSIHAQQAPAPVPGKCCAFERRHPSPLGGVVRPGPDSCRSGFFACERKTLHGAGTALIIARSGSADFEILGVDVTAAPCKHDMIHAGLCRPQIGRASCRERV